MVRGSEVDALLPLPGEQQLFAALGIPLFAGQYLLFELPAPLFLDIFLPLQAPGGIFSNSRLIFFSFFHWLR